MIDEEEVYNMILTNKIILRGSWNTINDVEFRKMRSGLLKDRSPVGRGDPRTKKPYHV